MLSQIGGQKYEKTDKKSIGMTCQEIQFVAFRCVLSLYYFEHGSLMQKCCQSFPKPHLRDSHNSKASRPFGAV